MSGDPHEPKMVGGDVVVAYMDGYLGYLIDYNISSYMPVRLWNVKENDNLE